MIDFTKYLSFHNLKHACVNFFVEKYVVFPNHPIASREPHKIAPVIFVHPVHRVRGITAVQTTDSQKTKQYVKNKSVWS